MNKQILFRSFFYYLDFLGYETRQNEYRGREARGQQSGAGSFCAVTDNAKSAKKEGEKEQG